MFNKVEATLICWVTQRQAWRLQDEVGVAHGRYATANMCKDALQFSCKPRGDRHTLVTEAGFWGGKNVQGG